MLCIRNKEDAEDLIKERKDLLDWLVCQASINDFYINKDEFEHIRQCLEALIRKIYCGVPCGEFIQAVIDNDLMEAFGKADGVNKKAMYIYVCFIYNYVDIQTLKKAKSNYFVMAE